MQTQRPKVISPDFNLLWTIYAE